MMNERGKSDPAVVAVKLANKGGPDAEPGNRVTGAGAHTSNRKNSDLPSLTRGRSRVRESRTYGSVRGAGSNLRPYRDGPWRCSKSSAVWGTPAMMPSSSGRRPMTDAVEKSR